MKKILVVSTLVASITASSAFAVNVSNGKGLYAGLANLAQLVAIGGDRSPVTLTFQYSGAYGKITDVRSFVNVLQKLSGGSSSGLVIKPMKASSFSPQGTLLAQISQTANSVYLACVTDGSADVYKYNTPKGTLTVSCSAIMDSNAAAAWNAVQEAAQEAQAVASCSGKQS